MNVNKIMVKYNKKNVCVLPIIPKFKNLLAEFYKNDLHRKRVKSNALYVISGINYIPTDYWNEVKGQKMVKMLIDEEILEEVKNENPKIESEIKKIKEKKEEIIEQKETKEQDLKKAKDKAEMAPTGQKRETQKAVKNIEKDLEKLEEDEKLTDEELLKLEESVNSFKALTKKQKEKILKETYDPRSLKKFFSEEQDSDIRHTIQMRIDEILNAKTDETIGHPEGHLKTSGK
jgi:hypothetical protein